MRSLNDNHFEIIDLNKFSLVVIPFGSNLLFFSNIKKEMYFKVFPSLIITLCEILFFIIFFLSLVSKN